MGAHHPRHAAPETGQMRRIALAVITPIAVLTLAAMIWLWPSDGAAAPENSGAAEQISGEVTAVQAETCSEPLTDDVNGCGSAQVRVTDGADKDLEIETLLPNGPGAPKVAEGDEVVLIETTSPEGKAYSIVDHQRGHELWMLAA